MPNGNRVIFISNRPGSRELKSKLFEVAKGVGIFEGLVFLCIIPRGGSGNVFCFGVGTKSQQGGDDLGGFDKSGRQMQRSRIGFVCCIDIGAGNLLV